MKSNIYQKELDLILRKEKLIKIEDEIDEDGITDESLKNAKRLLLLRNSQKKSRRELSEETGISQSTIKKYENGDMIAQGGTLSTIAKYFNLPLSYFINPDDILDTDIEFISSLRFYCWLLSTKSNHLSDTFSDGANLNENPRHYSKEIILLSVITACQIALFCLPDTDDYMGACYYIASCLSMNKFEENLQRDLNNGNPVKKIKKVFNEKLNDLSNEIKKNEISKEPSIDYLFRIIEFLVCNRRVVDKQSYNKIIQSIRPLIEIYKIYLSRRNEEFVKAHVRR